MPGVAESSVSGAEVGSGVAPRPRDLRPLRDDLEVDRAALAVNVLQDLVIHLNQSLPAARLGSCGDLHGLLTVEYSEV